MKRLRWLWLIGLPLAAIVAYGAGLFRSDFFAERPKGPGTVARPAMRVLWTFEVPERGAFLASPLVAGEHVYAAAALHAGAFTFGEVYCLEQKTGRLVWKFDDGRHMQHTYSSPCLAGGRLYLGEGMHQNFVCKLYCLDAASGKKAWHFEAAGHIESSPCVALGNVYFGAGDDGMYCIHALSGKQVWHFQEPLHIDASPVVAGSKVFVGSGVSLSHRKTEALCLDAVTGKVLWRVPADLPVWGSPDVKDEQVYFGLGNGRFLEPPQAPAKSQGAVWSIEIATGRRLWAWPAGDAVFCRPVVDERCVIVGCRNGFCYCLDRGTGKLRWHADLGSPVIARPALVGSHVYVVSSAGRVCRLDAESGEVQASFDVAGHSRTRPEVFSSPAVVTDPEPGGGQSIYFGAGLANSATSAAVVYCLRD
jgi:outer membrane protein assembly factor BamB